MLADKRNKQFCHLFACVLCGKVSDEMNDFAPEQFLMISRVFHTL